MVAYKIRKIGETFAVKTYSGAAPGDVIEYDRTKLDAVGDAPLCLLLDDIPTDSPPGVLTGYGEGTEFEDDTLDSTVGALIYSDGDGTYSASEPAGGAGTQVWTIGVVVENDTVSSSAGVVIRFQPRLYEKGA